MTITVRSVGMVLAALAVAGVYWIYGAGLLLGTFALSVSQLNFTWLALFRPLFYAPAVMAVGYLLLFRKGKSLFLESLVFFLALSLAILWTLELIIFF